MIVLDNNEKDIVIPDYNDLDNKPSINGVVLEGNKTAEELGIDIDTTNFYTKSQADSRFQLKGNYLTSIPSEYITETELNRKDFATNSDVNDEIGKLDSALSVEIDKKQNTLVSGTNIKTINGESILGDGNIEISGGGSVDLSDYYTKEEIDNIVENITIPYLVVNDDFTGYEAGDFESVRQAIINKKPYSIYIPSVLGGYLTPNAVDSFGGQITLTYVYHTNGTTMYYGRCYLHADNVNNTVESVGYATSEQLSKQGVYGIIVNYNEEYNEYTYKGVEFYSLKQAIENGNKLYSIYLPSSDNTYKIAAQEIEVVNDNEIRCVTIENNGDTQITTNWVIRFDNDFFEMDISKGNSTTINIATQEWIEEQGYLTSIPDEYVTESELTAKNYATKSEIPTIPTNVSSFNNDSGYITNSALNGYATETYVSNNYQPKGNYLTSIPSEYVTETELNDAIAGLGGGSNVPYVVIEYKNAATLTTISGDLQATLNAAKNNQPFLAYFYNTYNTYGKQRTLYPFTYVTVEASGFSLQYHTELGSVHKDIIINGSYDTTTGEYSLDTLGRTSHSYATTTQLNSKQDTLVSGTNIKTINGNSILGSGDLEITTDLSNYYTKTEIDTQIGNINTILENIIG